MFENAAPVDVVLAPSVEEFAERYARNERPVIVRGGVTDWLPSYKWTPEYLKAMYGTRRVKIGVSTNGDYLDYAERLNVGVEPEIAFANAIDGIFAPASTEQKCRVHQQPLDTWGALNEESPPIRYVLRKVIAKNIWMGSTGNVTKTHYDMEDNINVQLRGRKEIILFPSTQLDELYPRSAWDYMSNFSRVEIATPDLFRYPIQSRDSVARDPGARRLHLHSHLLVASLPYAGGEPQRQFLVAGSPRSSVAPTRRALLAAHGEGRLSSRAYRANSPRLDRVARRTVSALWSSRRQPVMMLSILSVP